MTYKTSQSVALTAVLTVGLFTTGLTTAFAETEIPFGGMYIGHDTDGDDLSGSFVDWGNYSAFEGIMQVHGTYEFVEDESSEAGGYYATHYIIADEKGNALSFETREISWTEYGDGKYGIAENEWKIVGGQGKYAGATGEGTESVWFNLDNMSYKGITTGSIFLS